MGEERPRVCIALPLEAELRDEVDARCEARHVEPWGPRDALLEAVRDAEGLLLSNQVALDQALLDAAPRLRVVSGFGVGYDRFDLEAATRRRVAVCNTPDVVTGAVVELTLGLILALARRLFDNAAYVREGGWTSRERPPRLGTDVRGRVLGIVGFGRIGTEVTRRAQALGMKTLWNDRFEELPPGAPESPFRPLEALLAESDFVSLHTDLNPTSHHLIGERELEHMKPTAYLLNTSRGPVVDQPALARALRAGRIAGAALDVLEQEPPRAEEPIVALPNVIALPHIGTATDQTRRAMRELAVRNLLDALEGRVPSACLNPEVL